MCYCIVQLIKGPLETKVVAGSFTAQSVLVQPPRDALPSKQLIHFTQKAQPHSHSHIHLHSHFYSILKFNAEEFLWTSESTWPTQHAKRIVKYEILINLSLSDNQTSSL